MIGPRLLRLASRRYLTRHPWQFGLSILGVALGVAVTVSVALANASALGAFEMSNEAITGPATHQIVAGDRGFDERLFRTVRMETRARHAAPVVEGWVALAGARGRALRVIGVDPLSEMTMGRLLARRPASARADDELRIDTLIGIQGAAVASPETRAALGVEPGETLALRTDTGEASVHLVDAWPRSDQSAALRDVLLMDIASAQDLLGWHGRLSRIDLVLDGQQEAEVRTVLPPGVALVAAASRSDAGREMTRAFRLNLTAMSLLALLCGLFLIYNTMTFAVVRRRELFGSLRGLGVTRAQLLRLVLGEGVVIGTLGTLAGLLGGVAIARRLIGLVARTINDLYFAVTVAEVVASPSVLALGAGLGIGGTVLASLVPAIEATSTTPRLAMTRSAIETTTRRRLPGVTLFGAAAVASGAALIAASAELVPTLVGLFLAVIGIACWTPLATLALSHLARRPMRRLFGAPGNLAARGVGASLSRMSVAVAALMIAVSLITGVSVMVDSFRSTLVGWLEYTLAADLFIAPAGTAGRSSELLAAESTLARLRADPGVAALGTLRRRILESAAGTTVVLVIGGDAVREGAYRLQQSIDRPWLAFENGAVFVSEPLAYRRAVVAGGRLSLATDRGPEQFAVAGVYSSYASDRGAVLMARGTYDRFWDDGGIDGVSLIAREGEALEALRQRARAVFDTGQALTVVSNRELREQALEVFDRTFLITSVLRALVAGVAFVGVLSTLMALQLERGREMGMLRAAGMSPGQLWTMVVAQTGLVGAIAGVLAAPVGLALAWIMIFVINRRSFGWTLMMEVPPAVLVQGLALSVAAALLAGLVPAFRSARSVPAGVLRDE